MSDVQCVGHEHKVADAVTTQVLLQIQAYLLTGVMPAADAPAGSPKARRFKQCAVGFTVHDGRLWKLRRDGLPRLAVLDEERGRTVIGRELGGIADAGGIGSSFGVGPVSSPSD